MREPLTDERCPYSESSNGEMWVRWHYGHASTCNRLRRVRGKLVLTVRRCDCGGIPHIYNPNLRTSAEIAGVKDSWIYDLGIHKLRAELSKTLDHCDRYTTENARLRGALLIAKGTIHTMHGDAAWPEYQHSPEMKAINSALKEPDDE